MTGSIGAATRFSRSAAPIAPLAPAIERNGGRRLAPWVVDEGRPPRSAAARRDAQILAITLISIS
jgi:hypothetical protein